MKCLVIQTAFLGDVILATPVIEKIKKHHPGAKIDVLVRKGNESLLYQHPHIEQVLILEKRQEKYRNLWRMLLRIRRGQYDKVINLHRFASSGLLTAFSGAREKIGFDKNPFSLAFDRRVKHRISATKMTRHEVDRNISLISHFTDDERVNPALYPSRDDYEHVFSTLVETGSANKKYTTLAPASVWFTKQLPEEKWVTLIQKMPRTLHVYLLGAPGDHELCERIRARTNVDQVTNLAGKLNLLQSAALMEKAEMNYVNDSAPLHLASAMNAPVSAFFCSTVPQFGFGPLSDQSRVLEIDAALPCRPCGLHGKRACPEGHFKCSDIDLELLNIS